VIKIEEVWHKFGKCDKNWESFKSVPKVAKICLELRKCIESWESVWKACKV